MRVSVQSLVPDYAGDLTPMVDVVFLLLIFFMCVGQFKESNYVLECFLPEEGSSSRPFVFTETVTIFYQDDPLLRSSQIHEVRCGRGARYYLGNRDGTPLANPAELTARLKVLAQSGADVHILVAPRDPDDNQTPFRNIVAVIDACSAAGLSKVKFQVP